MSTAYSILISNAVGQGVGSPLLLNNERYQGGTHSVEITGVFVGGIDIEVLIDTNWLNIDSLSVTGLLSITGTFLAIRANVTSYTSGSITVAIRYPLLQDLNVDIKTLITRLSAARASLLDNLNRLDVAVSTTSSKTPITNLTKLLRQYGKL